jgi:hypothetical protein
MASCRFEVRRAAFSGREHCQTNRRTQTANTLSLKLIHIAQHRGKLEIIYLAQTGSQEQAPAKAVGREGHPKRRETPCLS